jgi:hypothetical protein
MKTLLCALMLATLGTATAAASSVLMITFDNPDQIGMPGQFLEFTGTITNTSPDAIFLTSDEPNLSGLSLDVLDLFPVDVPHFLEPSGSTSACSTSL